MRELQESCKLAIAEGRCLGCTGLAEVEWQEPKECIYANKEYKFKTNEGKQIEL